MFSFCPLTPSVSHFFRTGTAWGTFTWSEAPGLFGFSCPHPPHHHYSLWRLVQVVQGRGKLAEAPGLQPGGIERPPARRHGAAPSVITCACVMCTSPNSAVHFHYISVTGLGNAKPYPWLLFSSLCLVPPNPPTTIKCFNVSSGLYRPSAVSDQIHSHTLTKWADL